jgi:pimeloyl-ACP methyl ester carboxylesterase
LTAFVLIHGAGSDSWYWHLVAEELGHRGHEVVAPDLPCNDDGVDLTGYANAVVDAIGDRAPVVLVAQSLGGFTAPLVAARVETELIVMLNAMIPAPGESAGEWWENTGWDGTIPETEDAMREVFLHDLPPELVAESATHAREQSGTPFEKPWPLNAWPDVPVRVLTARDDRFFPLDFQRHVARERLGLEVEEIDGGHLVALSRPNDVVDGLESYVDGLSNARPRRDSSATS